MQPLGPKIAEGRDSEIYDHGDGRVLRVPRDGRSLVAEAEIMRHVRSHGYPVPEVHNAGYGYLVMDRLEGATMMSLAGAPPSRSGVSADSSPSCTNSCTRSPHPMASVPLRSPATGSSIATSTHSTC